MNYITGIRFKISLVNMDFFKKTYEKPTRKIKSEATKVVPVWLHQTLSNYLKRFPFWDRNYKGKKIGLGDEYISIQSKIYSR